LSSVIEKRTNGNRNLTHNSLQDSSVKAATWTKASGTFGAGPPEEVSALRFISALRGDARDLKLQPNSVDLVVTSPPYWRKRDYKVSGQIGQERTPEEYVESILTALREWRHALRTTGSVFLNLGDTYQKCSLVEIPSMVMIAARADGWLIRNRIIWAKGNGTPDPVKNRLASRHEFIIHMTPRRRYYYDLFGFAEKFGNGANPGDVWVINPKKTKSEHLAPYPDEVVERILTLACPLEVCVSCGAPRHRVTRRTSRLNPERQQARRAMKLAREAGLTREHIAAIQATGISDAGKALHFQNGTSSAKVRKLAAEAKKILGGYFREFTFARRETVRWTRCKCRRGFMPGVVLDPFMGTGTTLRVAAQMGYSAIGVDLSRATKREFASVAKTVFV
jgi:DNA modification methylase